ncbi:MAG: RHS repeat-associated core domain-containing protein [Caldilineaceae bacterium]|nr:RHS repeat-associated core domain-containing protein [Caldilineaceae bacterium]
MIYIAGLYEYSNSVHKKYYEGPGGIVAVRDGSSLSYLLQDHLNSTARIVTSSGTIQDTTYYFPFGGKRAGNYNSITAKRFTGQYHEKSLASGSSEDGLYYYGARWYDAALGRFTQADTIVPNPGNPQDLNRYSYVRNNPLKYTDPSGHCPAPPTEMGATICLALFIQPSSVPAGPFTVKGDDRDFSSNSDPEKSRGYIWISLDSEKVESHMNPSGYYYTEYDYYPAAHGVIKVPKSEGIEWYEPSQNNHWNVQRSRDGTITVAYDVVISGPLEQFGTAPHINGTVTFYQDSKETWKARFVRDGFPWAEAYHHDGKGNVKTIFQDPAARGNPYDLFAIESNLGFLKWISKQIQSATVWFDAPIVNQRGIAQ